jgi:tight adherence protein B
VTALVSAVALAVALLVVSGRRRRLRARLPHVQVPMTAVTTGDASSGPMPVRLARQFARRWRRRRDVAGREAEAIEVVFALAAELRAGRPPGRALALVADTAPLLRAPLAEAAAAVGAGASPAGELRRVGVIPGCAGLLSVAAAWAVTESAGGAVAEVLDRLGDVLEADRQARAALDAALAAPRATMALLAALPVLGVVLGQSLGARPLHVFVHRPLGWALLAVGVTLDLVGVAWTRLLVSRALR